MGYKMSKHASLSHFAPYFLLFGRHPSPPSSIAVQKGQVVNLDSPLLGLGHTILRIKVIKPLGVLALQGTNECIIRDHSKNCAPCHLSNLDLTIIMLTWIPPLDYPFQVCQKIDDVNEMLFCNNHIDGYHLFCFKPKFTQVPANI
ncbi:hypothetical protein BDL97_07G113100 [Sphagnum fallax]|nr:hypothetical protein BDL97_07G113100 [Sphagnum fallax]